MPQRRAEGSSPAYPRPMRPPLPVRPAEDSWRRVREDLEALCGAPADPARGEREPT